MMAEIKVLIVSDNDTEEELQVAMAFSSLLRKSASPGVPPPALGSASTDQRNSQTPSSLWGLEAAGVAVASDASTPCSSLGMTRRSPKQRPFFSGARLKDHTL